MFFSPKWFHLPVIVLLLPLSLVYGVVMSIRRIVAKKESFDIPIVSIGNLIVGGSGKTPFVIALAKTLKGVTIISRGYGRQSNGLVEVSRDGNILCDVTQSGDEPMLMAKSLACASVIVSENRHQAIVLAKKQGAKVILLDDGFNRVDIKKFEILLEPLKIRNTLPFPAGAFREFFWNRRYADIVAKEGRDFKREVDIQNPKERMILVTAISNPSRLEPYLPKGVIAKYYLPDHAYFDVEQLHSFLKIHSADAILCTSKDKVKMEGFGLPIVEMTLHLSIDEKIIKKVNGFIQTYKKQK